MVEEKLDAPTGKQAFQEKREIPGERPPQSPIVVTHEYIDRLFRRKFTRREFLKVLAGLGLTGAGAYLLSRLPSRRFSELLPYLYEPKKELKGSFLNGIEKLKELDFEVSLNPYFRKTVEKQIGITVFPIFNAQKAGEDIKKRIDNGEIEIMCISEEEMKTFGKERMVLGVAKRNDKFIWVVTPNISQLDPYIISASAFHEYVHEAYLHTKEYQSYDKLTKEAIAYAYTVEFYKQVKKKHPNIPTSKEHYSHLEFLEKRYDMITHLSRNRQDYAPPPNVGFDEILWESWVGAIEELGYKEEK